MIASAFPFGRKGGLSGTFSAFGTGASFSEAGFSGADTEDGFFGEVGGVVGFSVFCSGVFSCEGGEVVGCGLFVLATRDFSKRHVSRSTVPLTVIPSSRWNVETAWYVASSKTSVNSTS